MQKQKESRDSRRGSVQSYKYAGKPLTEKIARELVIEIFSGETNVEKKEIKQTVDETHTSRGGSLSTNEMHPVSNALSHLKKQGLASNSTRGKWSIFSNPDIRPSYLYDSDAARTLGTGKSAIYLYYYPAYRCLAESQGKEFWACRIGSTESQAGTAMPEAPEIRLILKTDDSENLEQTLHSVLKFRGRSIANAPGKRWFMTSPSEVEEIYKHIMGSAS